MRVRMELSLIKKTETEVFQWPHRSTKPKTVYIFADGDTVDNVKKAYSSKKIVERQIHLQLTNWYSSCTTCCNWKDRRNSSINHN